MYCTAQSNYQNNKRCNPCGSCRRYSVCSKHHSIKYGPKFSEVEYGTTSKGLVQNLKNKILSIQNESLKLKNNRKPGTKKQKDYYCLMLRKINTLDKKLQNLEDLFLTHIDYETETALIHKDSKTINCEYLNFHNSIRSLLNLANKLKVEMLFRKHSMQCNDENSSEIYSKILALESELQDFSSYLEHLQENGAKARNWRKSFSRRGRRQFQNNRELNYDSYFTIDSASQPYDSGKKYNKEPGGTKSKNKCPKHYSNKFEQGFQESAPVSVTFVHSKKPSNSSSFHTQCRICNDVSETYFNQLHDKSFIDSLFAKKAKHKQAIDKSDCSCYICNSARKKWRFRNNKMERDEYEIINDLSLCSCPKCVDRYSKNDNKHSQESQLFSNTAGTQQWCPCSKKNKDFFHKVQRTFIREGTRSKPVYNAVDILYLQPNKTTFDKLKNDNTMRHPFENGLPLTTYSSVESFPNSFEENISTRHFKPVLTKPKAAKVSHKYSKYIPQESTHRTAQNKRPSNDIVYYEYEVIPEKAINLTKGISHEKPPGHNEGKTKQFKGNSYEEINTDQLGDSKNHREQRKSYVVNVTTPHKQLEKGFLNETHNSTHLKKNKLKKGVNSISNSSNSETDISTKNESCDGGLQFLVYNRNSKLNPLCKTPNKTYIDQKVMLMKTNGGTATESHHNTFELFENDFEDYGKKKPNNGYKTYTFERKRNANKRRKHTKKRKSGNSFENSEAVHFKAFHRCKYDPTYIGRKNSIDLATIVKNEDSSSTSNESSSVRKFVDKLNDLENYVCENCIVKEKQVKVSPHYLKQLSCKKAVKIIIEKEVIRCPDCSNKLGDKVVDVDDHKMPKSEHNQKFEQRFSSEKPQENNVDNNITLEKYDNHETNNDFGSNTKRSLKQSGNTTNYNAKNYLGNVGAVSIFQTNLDQDNMFKNPTVVQTNRLPTLRESSTNLSTSYKKGFDIVRKSSDKSNEVTSEVTKSLNKTLPITGKINKRDTSIDGIKSTSLLCNHNDKETKYVVEENSNKGDDLLSLLTPPKTVAASNKPMYSKNSNKSQVKSQEYQIQVTNLNINENNLSNGLYKDQSEIINKMSLVNSQENFQSYSNNTDSKFRKEKSHDEVTSNKMQNENKADPIHLATVDNKHKYELDQDTKPETVVEEQNFLHNASKLNHKKRNRLKDLNNNLDKLIVCNSNPIKKRNMALRDNSFVGLQNNPLGYEGYNYSNSIHKKQLFNTKKLKIMPFLKKNRSFDESSKCHCLSSSSTSKASSFTLPCRCSLCIRKRVGLRKSTRPTFNVGRRSSKTSKYLRINYSRPPSRTINHTSKPAIDYKKLTQFHYTCSQSPIGNVGSKYEFKDNNCNDKFITTATSESSFSVVNWATIAQKLKKEKY